jgi:hypothetical protein
MKIIGIVVGAALLTAAPFSMHCTPKKAGLYVDKADARVIYRRRPSYAHYGVPYYGATAYPRLFGYPAPYYAYPPYGVAPYPYSAGPPTLGGFWIGSK